MLYCVFPNNKTLFFVRKRGVGFFIGGIFFKHNVLVYTVPAAYYLFPKII